MSESGILRKGVFTVGDEERYDRALSEQESSFKKRGRHGSYPGGFACRTRADAEMLIVKFDKRGIWAVYELAADWERDTVPSVNGWWNALQNDAVVLRKCEPCNVRRIDNA